MTRGGLATIVLAGDYVARHRIGRRIGRVDDAIMGRVDRALARFLGRA